MDGYAILRVLDILGVDVIRVDLLPFSRFTLRLSPLGSFLAPFLTAWFLLDKGWVGTSVNRLRNHTSSLETIEPDQLAWMNT